ncbi:MAG: phosphoadenylyl-sulfate reductase [Acidobacteriota bacterium]
MHEIDWESCALSNQLHNESVRNRATYLPDDMTQAAEDLGDATPLARLRWAVARFTDRLVFATGFGAEGCVLIDLIGRFHLPVDIITLDTGLLFPETVSLWRRLENRYGLSITAVRPSQSVEEQAATHGPCLWETDPGTCCHRRKVEPLRRALTDRAAWLTAIRRDQTPARSTAGIVEWDQRFSLVKINPLIDWTAARVERHLAAHDVPTNPLRRDGFVSIGCRPCTTPVAAGEHERDGRWRGTAKTECGLHTMQAASKRSAAGGNLATPAPQFTAAAVLPVGLRLSGRDVLVVGGGSVAIAKARALLETGALVQVVATEVSASLADLPVRIARRPFQPEDLDAVWYAVAAATPDVNRAVAAAAHTRRVLVNVVDEPALATAWATSTIRRGGVHLSIASDGQTPALCRLLREALDHLLPVDLHRWSYVARHTRRKWRASQVPMSDRIPDLLTTLNRIYRSPPARLSDGTSPENP